MIIEWLGHSCFKIEESTGTTVVTDPYSSRVGFAMKEVAADAVTVSHDHFDHNCIKNILGTPEVISAEGAFEVKGIHVFSILSYHDDQKGKLRGENLVFKFRVDGVEVCHLGDIGEECSTSLVEAIGPVDVLMLPVGGRFTIDAEQAYEYVTRLMPSIVIPMHYRTENATSDIAEVDEFLDLFDEDCITHLEDTSIELDRTHFDGDFSTKVVVFKDKF